MYRVQVQEAIDLEEFEEQVYERLEKALGQNVTALLRDDYDQGWDE